MSQFVPVFWDRNFQWFAKKSVRHGIAPNRTSRYLFIQEIKVSMIKISKRDLITPLFQIKPRISVNLALSFEVPAAHFDVRIFYMHWNTHIRSPGRQENWDKSIKFPNRGKILLF